MLESTTEPGFRLCDGYTVAFRTSSERYSHFFGYYDKCPLSRDNTKLLSHRVSFDGRAVQDGDVAEVGYFDLAANRFVVCGETLAWNWQQGSQLQWLPPEYGREIIYNSICDGRFVSTIYNIETGHERTVPFPVYTVHPNGREALGINYERHYWCRPGYNYQNIKNKKWDRPYHEEDGIWRIDLSTGEHHRIVNIVDIINHEPRSGFGFHDHWLEHVQYNPTGSRFMFFHRWRAGDQDLSRVYSADANDGSALHMYPDVGFYSHYAWKNDHQLTIWSLSERASRKNHVLRNVIGIVDRVPGLKAIIKAVVQRTRPDRTPASPYAGSSLMNYEDRTPRYRVIGEGVLTGNGHQSWFADGEQLLNDTYQMEDGFRHLMTYDTKRHVKSLIGRFFSWYNDSGHRCDLHPRISLDNRYIVIDSAHASNRQIVVIDTRGQDAS